MKSAFCFPICLVFALVFVLPIVAFSGEPTPLNPPKTRQEITVRISEPKPLKTMRVVPVQPKIVVKPVKPYDPEALKRSRERLEEWEKQGKA